MFAFALYDGVERKLVLARDQFGIKPLFYHARDGRLAFASELKALRQMMGDVRVDESALVASVMYSWVPESHCMFEGAQKLAPGTWLEIGPDGVSRVHRYWDPVSRAAEARAVEHFRAVRALRALAQPGAC